MENNSWVKDVRKFRREDYRVIKDTSIDQDGFRLHMEEKDQEMYS
jgi:hypothetical protein